MPTDLEGTRMSDSTDPTLVVEEPPAPPVDSPVTAKAPRAKAPRAKETATSDYDDPRIGEFVGFGATAHGCDDGAQYDVDPDTGCITARTA